MNTIGVTAPREGINPKTFSERSSTLAANDPPSQNHHFELDLSTSTLRRSDGRTLQLTGEEATVLVRLLKQQRKPLASHELLAVLNKTRDDYPLARLNGHLYRLRQKLIMFDGRLVVSHARRMSCYYSGPEIQVVSF